MQKVVVNSALSQNEELSEKELMAYLSMLLQLDSLMYNVTKDFEEKLKAGNLYKFEIKKNVKEIYRKLKENPKCNWNNFDTDAVIAFGDDGEVIETMFYRLFGLTNGRNICFAPIYAVGDKVWVMHNRKPTLCEVMMIQIVMSLGDKKSITDDSYYELNVIKKNKLSDEVIQKGESEIYKHKKDLYEAIEKQNNGEQPLC